jgi:O-antigen/teichoic acid export membrane protein
MLFTTGVFGTALFITFLVRYFNCIKIFRNKSNISKGIYFFMIISMILKLFSEGVDMVLNYFLFFSITGSLAGFLHWHDFQKDSLKKYTANP